MTITLLLIVCLLALFLTWILSQTVNVRPWVAGAPSASTPDRLPGLFTARRAGLIVFLAAVSSLFALTISIYSMRMGIGDDWSSVPLPNLMWINTALLVAGSIAFHRAWRAAAREDMGAMKRGLALGGAGTMAFVIGQYMVCQQLYLDGYYLAANPANSFFYLITVLHALHLLGGLAVWAVTMTRVWQSSSAAPLLTTIELCTVYWHYLLVLWAVLFGLLLAT